MGGCFSCQRRRPRAGSYKVEEEEDPAKLLESQEKGVEIEKPPEGDSGAQPTAPPASPPPAAAGEAGSCSLRGPDHPAGLVAPVPESVPQAALTLSTIEQQLGVLKELQGHYLRGQLRVRRLCRLFPRALRIISLQVCHARKRLIRIEVRLKRQEGREGPPALPASSVTPQPRLPAASTSQGILSIESSLSSFSLPLPPCPPPPPSPPLLRPDLRQLKEGLETLVERQAHQLQERKRDLRGCQECLKSLKALRAQLRSVRKRLWVLEGKLGVQVPPRELDTEEEEEEEEEEKEEPPETPPPRALETSREEPEETAARGT